MIVGQQVRKIMALDATAALMEMAIDARQLSANKADAMLQRKIAALPDLVVIFDQHHARHLPEDQRIAALWGVQRFYEENPSVKLPARAKAILDALPPRPPTSCELEAASATRPTEGAR